jgi:hypothetical protein
VHNLPLKMTMSMAVHATTRLRRTVMRFMVVEVGVDMVCLMSQVWMWLA